MKFMEHIETVNNDVAPFAGAWIEMSHHAFTMSYSVVAPFAGAWIEIYEYKALKTVFTGRSLRGSVD